MAFDFRAILLTAVAVAFARGAPSADEPAERVNTTGFQGPIDLSHPIGTLAQNWPGSRTFAFTEMVASEQDGVFLSYNEFCMAEHSGTHLDAPYHFSRTGWKVEQIPLRHLLVPGVLIDASEAAAANRDLSLGKDALDSWEREHGRVPQGSVVLLRFGWASKYGDRVAYFGSSSTADRSSNDTSGLSFPGVSKELAEALVERKIVGVGLDTPSIDPGSAGDHTPFAHVAFCEANIYILENVDLRTSALPAKGFTLIVMPANIEHGTGAPVRIVAIPGNRDFWKP